MFAQDVPSITVFLAFYPCTHVLINTNHRTLSIHLCFPYRSNYLEDWEQQVASSEGETTSADKTVADYEAKLEKQKEKRQKAPKASAGLVDKQLSNVLETRNVKHEGM